MTVGQRIAQKRKEQNLSQEALGEQMGVSRQAIYKWESDQALPEIEKLVALSKLFAISVGWLLGVEEEGTSEHQEEPELTASQMKMVSQIVEQYVSALPQPKPRRKWPVVVAACLLAVIFIQLFGRMDQLNSQYQNLQNSVGNISYNVNSQIGHIANRVEEILMAQNNLTAAFSTYIVETDYRNGTVKLSMEAVPKTYTQGMGAVFVVDCGDGPVEYESTFVDSHKFACQAEVPLTDSITASVVFISSDGTRYTQVLDNYSGLLSDSYGNLDLDYSAFSPVTEFHNGTYKLTTWYVNVWQILPGKGGAEITEMRVGVFRNQKLIAWGEHSQKPPNYFTNVEDMQFFKMPEMTLEDLQEGETIEIAALVTDSYGRQYMICDVPNRVRYDANGVGSFTWSASYSSVTDLSHWEFE